MPMIYEKTYTVLLNDGTVTRNHLHGLALTAESLHDCPQSETSLTDGCLTAFDEMLESWLVAPIDLVVLSSAEPEKRQYC